MNKLQFELADIIFDEIKKHTDIISGYHLHIEIDGNINIRLMYKIPGSTTVLTTQEIITDTEIKRIAYPRDWIRYKTQVLVNSLRIREREVQNND